MRIRIIVWVILSAVLGGCAQTKAVKKPSNGQHGQIAVEAPGQSQTPEQFIATDLVNALVQVPSLNPQTTSLYMWEPEQGFGQSLRSALIAAGYQVEIVKSGQGAGFVGYTHTNLSQSLAGESNTYQISIGSVAIKRDYRSINGVTEPASELYASGVDPAVIELSNPIFSSGTDALVPATPNEISNLQQPDAEPAPVEFSNLQQPDEEPAPVEIATLALVGAEPIPVALTSNEKPETSFRMRVNGQFTPEPVVVGENIIVTLETIEAAHVSCYYQDDSAFLVRLYPNRFTAKHTLAEGEVITIPSSDAWSLVAGKAGYQEEIFCVSMPLGSDSALASVEAYPDLAPLPIDSFDELLLQLTPTTGVPPQSQLIAIPVTY